MAINITNLSESEVKQLLSSIKNCTKAIPGDTPIIGKIKDDTPVVDFQNHIKYKLHRYRGSIETNRFSLHIRFQDNNQHLIRICVNNGKHRNPDGSIAPNNHMHIYNTNKNYSSDSIATPLPDVINDLSSLFIVLRDFLTYTNTIDEPKLL